MEKTGTTTVAELNSTYAKLLTASDQAEIDAIDALSNAMGMTYDALGSMLARYGYKLQEVLSKANEWGIRGLGNGKVEIFDFKAFAEKMQWAPDSEAYTEAYKAYVDA